MYIWIPHSIIVLFSDLAFAPTSGPFLVVLSTKKPYLYISLREWLNSRHALEWFPPILTSLFQ